MVFSTNNTEILLKGAYKSTSQRYNNKPLKVDKLARSTRNLPVDKKNEWHEFTMSQCKYFTITIIKVYKYRFPLCTFYMYE